MVVAWRVIAEADGEEEDKMVRALSSVNDPEVLSSLCVIEVCIKSPWTVV